ncbi:MAG: hypothetical protein RBR67_06760 [Desulfobacterium sp.]|nr:hypothetical protein [Desulfobacterium sp.]
MTAKTALLTWEIKFPLLTNPHIVMAWGKAMCVVCFVIMLILSPVFIATGEIESLPMMALIFLAVIFGITLAGFLVMLITFGNHSNARFVLSEKGISYESIDNRARIIARMALLAGGLAGNPSLAGAGLLSVSKERVNLDWKAVFEARYDDKYHTIRLRNHYRDVLHLYCTPEIYPAARDLAMEKVGQHGEQNLAEGRSPLPGALFATLLVIVACMPLYALVEIVKFHLMIPLLIMLFSLAMIWMIPLFAWVVLLLVAYIPIHLAWALFESRTIKLANIYSFRGYEFLDAGEWIVIGCAMAGLIYLCWISVRSLKGRYVPVLMRDQQGM